MKGAPADIEGALSALGIEIIGGSEYEIKGRCPKHLERTGKEDRHPSWSINRQSGLHGCFSCGFQGNFLGLVMDLKFRNDVFRAQRWIKQFGVSFDAVIETLKFEPVEVPVELDLRARYASYIAPPAWALEARNLTADACKHYGVRWEDEEERWIIPIRDVLGTLIGWQIKGQRDRFFRNFPGGVKKGRTLFGLDVFPEGSPAILVESPLDVVRLYVAGYEGGLATYGASWTDLQMRAVSEVASEIIVVFDNDRAGQDATRLLVHGDKTHRAWAQSITCWLATYTEDDPKDIGDMTDNQIARIIEQSEHWAMAVVR